MGPGNSEPLFDLLPAFLVILGLGIVAILGWLTRVFLRSGRSRTSDTRGKALSTDVPSDAIADHISQPAPFLTMSHRGGVWEILIRGQRYTSLDTVPDTQTQEEVMEAIRSLAKFANSYIQQRQNAASVAPSAADRGSVLAPPPHIQPVPVPDTYYDRGTAAPRPDLADIGLVSRRSTIPPAFTPSMNLAQEIGDIVDEMLKETPGLEGHAVTLTSAAGGGVMFMVDGKVYTDIDEIPQLEIRELIRAATREWERR